MGKSFRFALLHRVPNAITIAGERVPSLVSPRAPSMSCWTFKPTRSGTLNRRDEISDFSPTSDWSVYVS